MIEHRSSNVQSGYILTIEYPIEDEDFLIRLNLYLATISCLRNYRGKTVLASNIGPSTHTRFI